MNSFHPEVGVVSPLGTPSHTLLKGISLPGQGGGMEGVSISRQTQTSSALACHSRTLAPSE